MPIISLMALRACSCIGITVILSEPCKYSKAQKSFKRVVTFWSTVIKHQMPPNLLAICSTLQSLALKLTIPAYILQTVHTHVNANPDNGDFGDVRRQVEAHRMMACPKPVWWLVPLSIQRKRRTSPINSPPYDHILTSQEMSKFSTSSCTLCTSTSGIKMIAWISSLCFPDGHFK